jgi:methanogenic corrinoid protein MtbC1
MSYLPFKNRAMTGSTVNELYQEYTSRLVYVKWHFCLFAKSGFCNKYGSGKKKELVMTEIIEKIALCIEEGKVDKNSPFPQNLAGQDGADELTEQALAQGVDAQDILTHGLMAGMKIVGEKFRDNKIFVPNVLMSAKAMTTAMGHLKPYFLSGQVQRKGIFVIGTVAGDLHDIGKNLVAMIIEGGGWEIVNLGADVSTDKFTQAVEQYPGCAVGMSALLTTTMTNMGNCVKAIKEKNPDTKVIVGGAPLTQEFADQIGADHYSPDPQGAVDYLNNL